MAKIKNDLTASELISKSLSGDLSEIEEAALREYMEEAEEAKSLSKLSNLIQSSVAAMTDEESIAGGDDEGLSQIAKERLKRSIQNAQRESKLYDLTSDPGQTVNVAEPYRGYEKSGDPEQPDETRRSICGFTLKGKIGQGGLGTVWAAHDESLQRTVALKEMTPKAAQSTKLWKRFQREAEITGHLEHPNVVPLYMSGTNDETGLPFYVMRFLGKQTLAEAIREYHARRAVHVDDPIELHRLLNSFLDVCQAIAFAHSRGVIHRDLKPENVALDNFGQVLVLDWGLAKIESEGELAGQLLRSGSVDSAYGGHTLDGDVVGTPLYMSPEQAAGNLDEIDARTDVYGLGAILFAILTGSAPHENSHKTSDGTLKVKEFLSSIATSDTPTPHAINPSVPNDLEAICKRAMAKDKFARYGSATELATAVERWIAGIHEKESRYDSIRMTGRDLKSRLCVQLRQLAASAQFMVELPPIQGLLATIQNNDDADFATWRERLSTILLALAKSKPNMSALSYSQIDDDRINELVRIERSVHDVANVRGLPQSRLRKGVVNTFHKIVMQQFPGEFSIDFDCTTAGTVRLVCGVPVFDETTEEPFGLVSAEAEIGNLVRPELEVINSSNTVFVVDDNANVLFTSCRETATKSVLATDIFEDWDSITRALADEPEYIDSGRLLYANVLRFPQKNNSMHIVFKSSD